MSMTPSTTQCDWPYDIAPKPLQKWANQRVSFDHSDDGLLDVTFRFDGSTCTNLGKPLAVDFVVSLRAAEGDWQIRAARCAPAVDDDGCAATCAAMASPDSFYERIRDFAPIAGRTLDEALAWSPDIEYSGCLCSEGNLNHKWRNAIQAIHLAVTTRHQRQEKKDAS